MTVAVVMLLAITAGWENVEPMRTEIAPAKVVWRAPIERGADAFTVERMNGAEGTVVFSNGVLTVEKTNEHGVLVVTAEPFSAATNQPLRLMADVHCDRGDYFSANAGLRAYGTKRSFTPCWELEGRYFSLGGTEEMQSAVNQAPGMTNRKFCHFRATEGRVTPMIVVSGSPSRTSWTGWLADDLDAADAKWAGYYEARTAHDHAAERIDESEFDRLIAADVDHSACLMRIDGVTRLVVDGKVAYPCAYRAKAAFGKDILMETFAGGPLVREGVKLVVKGIAMGGSKCAADGLQRRYWTSRGFDAVGAVKDIKDSLRITPDALCILSVQCNAYPDFTLKEHPDEVWVKADGSVVMGTSGSCVASYDDMGVRETNRWPWVSYASPAWRAAVKDNLRQLIAELRRQGISKRIVGLHLFGYHDGQFHSPFEDHSRMAKEEFQRYLKEDPVAVNDFAYFSKLLGLRAQEDFGRLFKSEIGKPTLVIRWNMGPFSSMADLTSFAFSDVADIIVPQPTYTTRRPGLATEMKLPYSSFNLHGKMYWNEFDLRTYAALETWAASGVVATKGLGQMDDLAMWRSAYRRLAGMMFAHDSGYWFYDMGGGWFSAPEIARDVGAALKTGRELLARPSFAWKPDVAVVADEEGMGIKPHPFGMDFLRNQQQLFAASGVPFDFYLAEDVLRDHTLLKSAKMVVMAFFRNIDERRRRLTEAISRDGRTVVWLSECGIRGGAEATGFDVAYSTNAFPHAIEPVPGVPIEEARGMMAGTRGRLFPVDSVPSGPRCTVAETPDVRVLARYRSDGAVAIAERSDSSCRKIYVCEPAGLSPALFNRLACESGAYVPVSAGGLQVDMNGRFISVHALRSGRFDFKLPFPTTVVNLRSGVREETEGGILRLEMTAGETCWFSMDRDVVRVGSYNIRMSLADQDTPNEWERRKADLVGLVKRLELDVFGAQEVCPDQARYLRENLSEFEFVGEHREADRVSGEASPVFYRRNRFEAEKSGTFWLSETPDIPGKKGWGSACPRVCSYLVLRDRQCGRRFCVANTHTDHVSAMTREEGMKLIIDRMRKFGEGCPIVFVGDHNCGREEAPAKIVRKVLADSRDIAENSPKGPHNTFQAFGKIKDGDDSGDNCIDYIYVSEGVRVIDHVTHDDVRPGTSLYPSDHFPITATILLP